MADGASQEGAKYRAFISYSHKDAAFGRRLHRRLESYRLPQRLVGRKTLRGVVPRRLAPIFRDIDELPAAADLTAEVRDALNASACLVVVCSPAAAASKWVAREIAVFRALHPDRPILAAIADGAPPDCFPEGLSRSGGDGERVESLAADFRAGRDGAGLALLKLVAGITGLGLDELVQRDAQRRTRRVMAVTAAALAAVVVMGGLTAFAVNARFEAERQRKEAEGLVEYMLTDLRDRLKGVGRLDVMTAVNERALAYYSDQDLKHLSADSLERRARILHAMGEDDETRGNHEAALAKFREAARTTSALLAQSPNDPERIFAQAQSEYWLGEVDYERGRFPSAKAAFLRYKALADRMIALAPNKTKYRMEAAYAENNLCWMALKTARNLKNDIIHCKTAVIQIQEAIRHPDAAHRNQFARGELDDLLTNSLGNMADAYRLSGDLDRATAERMAEQKLVDHRLTSDQNNMDLRDTWIAIQIGLASVEKDRGHNDAARNLLLRALSAADALHDFEPSNSRSRRQRDFIVQQLATLKSETH